MVRVWLSVNLKRHGVDCGGTVGGIGPGTRAGRSQTDVAASWPRFGYRGANPLNVLHVVRGKSLWLPELGFEGHMKWAKAMP